jgi:hypothetical protein
MCDATITINGVTLQCEYDHDDRYLSEHYAELLDCVVQNIVVGHVYWNGSDIRIIIRRNVTKYPITLVINGDDN